MNTVQEFYESGYFVTKYRSKLNRYCFVTQYRNVMDRVVLSFWDTKLKYNIVLEFRAQHRSVIDKIILGHSAEMSWTDIVLEDSTEVLFTEFIGT